MNKKNNLINKRNFSFQKYIVKMVHILNYSKQYNI